MTKLDFTSFARPKQSTNPKGDTFDRLASIEHKLGTAMLKAVEAQTMPKREPQQPRQSNMERRAARREKVLEVITSNPGISRKECAFRAGVSADYITRIVYDLKKAGLVRAEQPRGQGSIAKYYPITPTREGQNIADDQSERRPIVADCVSPQSQSNPLARSLPGESGKGQAGS